MVRTQSKNKDDIEASKDLLKEVNECLHDMYDEAFCSSGVQAIGSTDAHVHAHMHA